MEEKTYLYFTTNYGREQKRCAIIRESKSNYWIKGVNNNEIMISKKTMRSGSGWNAIYYENETPALLEKFLKDDLIRRYNSKLSKLANCKDENIMKKIIEIKID